MKLPSFQFYPGDWLNDMDLRSVSPEARALWIDMLCLMSQSYRRGFLMHSNGKPFTNEEIARISGFTLERASLMLKELDNAGVFSLTESNVIFNRRMMRDEVQRKIWKKLKREQRMTSKNSVDNSIYDGKCPTNVQGVSNRCPSLLHSSSSSSSSPSGKNTEPPIAPQGGSSLERNFDEFWQAYPRKQAKKPALRAWLKLKPEKELFAKIMGALQVQKTSEQWHSGGGKFIPHPATWLNQLRWDDDLKPDVPSPGIEKIIRAYQLAKNQEDNPNWRKTYFHELRPIAEKLLTFFGGNSESAIDCLAQSAEEFIKAGRNDWNLNWVIREAENYVHAT